MFTTSRAMLCLSYALVFGVGFGAGALLFDSPLSDSPSNFDDTASARTNTEYQLATSDKGQPSDTASDSLLGLGVGGSLAQRKSKADLILNLLSQGKGALTRAKISLLLGQWVDESPIAALDFLLENALYEYVDLVMEITGRRADQRILPWLSDNASAPQSAYWYDSYLRNVALESPADALESLSDVGLPASQQKARAVIIDQWAMSNASAALDWLQGSDLESDERSLLHKAVLLRYATQDPWQAATFIGSLPEWRDQSELISGIAVTLSMNDIESASDWVDTLDNTHKKNAMSSVLSQWMTSAPANDIVDFLVSRSDRLEKQSILKQSISEIAAREPKLLISRLSEFPDTAKSDVIQAAARGLSESTDANPESLINSIESDSLRDFAWQRVTENEIHSNPENAFRFAANIANDGQRKHYLDLVVRAWGQVDPVTAIRAINASTQWTQQHKKALIDNIQSAD